MDKCHYCDKKKELYGLCNRCRGIISDYQQDVVMRHHTKRPFEDHIVGTVTITVDELKENKVISTSFIYLPAYDFMHLEANDDYSPDSTDYKLHEETLEFEWETSEDSSLEAIISGVYLGSFRDGFDVYGTKYIFRKFKYSFEVCGSHKKRIKKMQLKKMSEAEIQAERLLDLY